MYSKISTGNGVYAAALALLSILAVGSSFIIAPDNFLPPTAEDDSSSSEQQYPVLSSFELFSITDLLMEISLRPCSFVSRPLMGSIKKFIVTGLSNAPQQSYSHADFYSTYHSLVNCLSRTDDTYSKVKSLNSPFPTGSNVHSTKRQKRMSIDDGEENDSNPKGNHLATHHEFLEELSIIDPSLSFEEFFSLLLSITDQTCNKEMNAQLPIDFMVPLLSEVTYWAKSQGSSVYKTAQVKYFHNSRVLDELRKCERTFQSTPSAESTSTVPPKK